MQAKSQPYLTTLTPLRGIAALLVVIYHSNLMFAPFMPPGFTHFFDNGWLWVDFFFVLSGFIMCYTYGKYFTANVNKVSYKKYIGARFARIYPLHFITTFWVFACSVITVNVSNNMQAFNAEIINPKALPASLLLIQSLHLYFIPPLNTPSWSLSTEWWVYMVFPFLVPYFIKLKNTGKIFTTLLIIVFYVFLRYFVGPKTTFGPNPTLNIMADFGVFRCLAGFITGMLFFNFYENRAGYSTIKHDWFFILCCVGVLAAMHFGAMDLIIIAFFPFILISAAYNQTGIKRILDTRTLQRLGNWSFSIYMVHVPIIITYYMVKVIMSPKWLDIPLPVIISQNPNYGFGLVVCIGMVVLTLILAALFYRFIEIPSRNYFNRVFKTKHKEVTVDTLKV